MLTALLTRAPSTGGRRTILAVLSVTLFFLPYIGSSTFRIDQFVGIMAVLVTGLVMVATQEAPRFGFAAGRSLWLHAISILIYVAIRAVPSIGAGNIQDAMRIVLNFSYPAAGISFLWLLAPEIKEERDLFIKPLLVLALVINAVALISFALPVSAFAQFINSLYSGPISDSYGARGNLATVTLYQGRGSGLFAHPMALAVFNLLITALTIARFKTWQALALALSVAAGLATGTKTFILAFIVLLVSSAAIGTSRFYSIKKAGLTFIIIIAAVFAIFFLNNAWTEQWLRAIANLDSATLFGSRFGPEGWILRSGTLAEALKTRTLLHGLGLRAYDFAWADCGFLQPLLFGGLPFFILFFSFPVRIFILHWQKRNESLDHVWQSALILSLLACNLGVGPFLFPRVAFLFFFLSLQLLLERA